MTRRDGTGLLAATSSMTYTPLGDVETVDGPLSGTADTTRTRYNGARQVVGVIGPDPDGSGALTHRAVRTSYGADGLPTVTEQGTVASQSDAAWAAFSPAQAVETDYDARHRPVVQRLVSGSTTYSLTQAGYDALGRPRCTAQRMNPAEFATASLPADACTPDTEGSDGPDRITRLSYDDAGRTIKLEVGVGVTGTAADEVAATYTANGQTETLTDGEGNRTSYAYDGHDRAVRTCYLTATPSACTTSASDREELTYDAGGNVVAQRQRDGSIIGYDYDALNRVYFMNLPGSDPDVTYTHDLLGQLTGASTTAQALSFTYDALGRQLSETGPLGTVSRGYDAGGRRISLSGPTFYAAYDYLTTGELHNVYTDGPSITYGYDSLGRRTSMDRANGTAQGWSYDAAGRLGHHLTRTPLITRQPAMGPGL